MQNNQTIMENTMVKFENHLKQEEKSLATIKKYLRDVRLFYTFLEDRPICKTETIAYKQYLFEKYSPTSVNYMLVALNVYLRFISHPEYCVKLLKIQRQIFCEETKNLTKEEYIQLVKAARTTQLSLILQTICCTGIRVSELQCITTDSIYSGRATVTSKNKTRTVFIAGPLQKMLKKYIKEQKIRKGPIFLTPNGKPIDRSTLWRKMKKLCKNTGIHPDKVFPHNLRHLFAKTFYSVEKDIIRLADLLGHSNINTTRIYTAETEFRQIYKLQQVQNILVT